MADFQNSLAAQACDEATKLTEKLLNDFNTAPLIIVDLTNLYEPSRFAAMVDFRAPACA
jgi:hypothetical protein